MRIKLVTCMGPSGWELYGKTFVDSFLTHWPTDVSLEVWHHGWVQEPVLSSGRVSFHALENTPTFVKLQASLKGSDGPSLQYCFKAAALGAALTQELDWIAFVDADTETMRPVTPGLLSKLFDNDAHLTYLYRKSVSESEGSWFAFNLRTAQGASLLADFWGVYDSFEAFQYKKSHDNAVLDRLVAIHRAHGLVARNLAEGALGLDAFHQSPLGEYMVHYKGPDKTTIADPAMMVPSRYAQVATMAAHAFKVTGQSKIVEVGTWNGTRAIHMANTLFAAGAFDVEYVGFDTFELGNDRMVEGHSKYHANEAAVSARFANYASVMLRKGSTFKFTLVKGNSQETLPPSKELVEDAIFAYLDGGHSTETVRSDYQNLKHIPYVVFDDVIVEAEEAAPEGPRTVYNELDVPKRLLHTQDGYQGCRQGISLGVVVREGYEWPDLRTPITVKPVESVPSVEQYQHIAENSAAIKKWLPIVQAHNKRAIFVSAGPTLKAHLAEIKMAQLAGGHVFAVKHAIPMLVEAGIVPNYAVVLDPRPVDDVSTHGVKRTELFAAMPQKTKVLMASMTNTSVRQLLEKMGHEEIWGWHAFTNNTAANTPPGFEKGMVVGGGTCAATRMPMLAYMMGFRRYTFYGFDFFYDDDTDPATLTQELMPITLNNSKRVFKATGELVAAMQDLIPAIKWMTQHLLTVDFVGDGVGRLLWENEAAGYKPPVEWAATKL